MSARCRLLALDIDGTLLGTDSRVSERTRAAVLAARAQGVRLVLVTGRRYPTARRIAEGLGPGIPLVLHNGAIVVEEGDILRSVPLPRAAALTAIRIGRAHGADPVVHAGQRGEGRLLVQDVAPTNPLLARYLDRSRADVVRVADLEAAVDEDPMQVMFGGVAREMGVLWPRLCAGLAASARVERTLYPALGVGILDVLEPGAGKAVALAFLQGRWGLSAAETVAIGDNWNDHEMLARAGRGLVMGNADAALRALGLEVLPTNDEDGVAVAIERYVLAKSIRG